MFVVGVRNNETDMSQDPDLLKTTDLSFLSKAQQLVLNVDIDCEKDLESQTTVLEEVMTYLKDSSKLKFLFLRVRVEREGGESNLGQAIVDGVKSCRELAKRKEKGVIWHKKEIHLDLGFRIVEVLKRAMCAEGALDG